jgi:hypothetical protein
MTAIRWREYRAANTNEGASVSLAQETARPGVLAAAMMDQWRR